MRRSLASLARAYNLKKQQQRWSSKGRFSGPRIPKGSLATELSLIALA